MGAAEAGVSPLSHHSTLLHVVYIYHYHGGTIEFHYAKTRNQLTFPANSAYFTDQIVGEEIAEGKDADQICAMLV